MLVKLRIFISFRLLSRRVTDFSHTLLGGGANEISLHIVDTPLWIDKELLAFALDLNLPADHTIYHVNWLLIAICLVFLVDSVSPLNRIILTDLIGLNLLNCLVIVVLDINFRLAIDTHLAAILSWSRELGVWNGDLAGIFQRWQRLLSGRTAAVNGIYSLDHFHNLVVWLWWRLALYLKVVKSLSISLLKFCVLNGQLLRRGGDSLFVTSVLIFGIVVNKPLALKKVFTFIIFFLGL